MRRSMEMADREIMSSEIADVQSISPPSTLNLKEVAGDFVRGLWEEIPLFRLVLGMCPTLAVTTSATNGVGMGIATTFVLVASNIMISLLRKIIPGMVRGFTLVLILLGSVREILGNGTWFDMPALTGVMGLFDYEYQPMIVMVLPPGAFIGLGLLVALANKIEEKRKGKR